jgi:phenylalanyl-tRNA synthetase alpha chain
LVCSVFDRDDISPIITVVVSGTDNVKLCAALGISCTGSLCVMCVTSSLFSPSSSVCLESTSSTDWILRISVECDWNSIWTSRLFCSSLTEAGAKTFMVTASAEADLSFRLENRPIGFDCNRPSLTDQVMYTLFKMAYSNSRIAEVADKLIKRLDKLENKAEILRAPELKALYDELKLLDPKERASFGKEVNQLKAELTALAENTADADAELPPIDVTAPFDVNTAPDKRPRLLSSELGSKHPLMSELENILDIFYRMGFNAVESREIDDDFHMFESLNFPEGHPARDDYDTFMTTEGLIAPAHTSTMQNRVLKQHKASLEKGEDIRVVIPGRVFRNEDLDATHEHTFYQLEGVYVGKGIHAGHLIATLKTFLEAYYQQELKVKTQPFYFPFTEPSFEFAIERPKELRKGTGTTDDDWLELLGCGMIHPNVLKVADIDPNEYTGFAWGGGIDRLVLMKYGIEDIRHFESGKLEFLRQFK